MKLQLIIFHRQLLFIILLLNLSLLFHLFFINENYINEAKFVMCFLAASSVAKIVELLMKQKMQTY
jgi:hypothetical protein